MSTRVIRRFGTGRVTLVSVAMTAFAPARVFLAPQVGWLCLLAVPLGLGAGSVDAGLNNFVALHYQAKHMSWLHCFWGIGATAGPIVMAFWIDRNNNWHAGVPDHRLAEVALVAVLLFSLPLWKKVSSPKRRRGRGRGGPAPAPGIPPSQGQGCTAGLFSVTQRWRSLPTCGPAVMRLGASASARTPPPDGVPCSFGHHHWAPAIRFCGHKALPAPR